MPNILLDVETVEGYKRRIAELKQQVASLEGERDRYREALMPLPECGKAMYNPILNDWLADYDRKREKALEGVKDE